MKDIEDKIPNISNLAINTTLNNKINRVKGEVSLITSLLIAATAALKTIEIKIPDQSKYTTTPEFHELTERVKQANLATKDNAADVGKKIFMIIYKF